ncbi:hypothetical protein P9112_002279 [Eukaryota sp. TZLM1-RC]
MSSQQSHQRPIITKSIKSCKRRINLCVIHLVSSTLNRVIKPFESSTLACHKGFSFGLSSLRSTIENLVYICKSSEMETPIFIAALVYIDSVITNNEQNFRVTPMNVNEVVLISCCIADKTYNDHSLTNSSWALIGQTTVHRINNLEAKFLKLLDYKTIVSTETFHRYRKIFTKAHESN